MSRAEVNTLRNVVSSVAAALRPSTVIGVANFDRDPATRLLVPAKFPVAANLCVVAKLALVACRAGVERNYCDPRRDCFAVRVAGTERVAAVAARAVLTVAEAMICGVVEEVDN